MAKIYPGIDMGLLRDIQNVAVDPAMRTAVTPFGMPAGAYRRYVGKSVPWKMVKGIEEVKKINPDVAKGLAKAIAISKAQKGKYGVAIVHHFEKGVNILMPYKAGLQMEAQKTGKVITTYPSYYRLIPVFAPAIAPAPAVSPKGKSPSPEE